LAAIAKSHVKPYVTAEAMLLTGYPRIRLLMEKPLIMLELKRGAEGTSVPDGTFRFTVRVFRLAA
jgi:hypothetical protein